MLQVISPENTHIVRLDLILQESRLISVDLVVVWDVIYIILIIHFLVVYLWFQFDFLFKIRWIVLLKLPLVVTMVCPVTPHSRYLRAANSAKNIQAPEKLVCTL